MNRIAVVTDSSASLPAELARQWDIHVVPSVVVYKGRAWRDGQDITPGELYRWLRASELVPTTSAPSIGDFVRVYATLSSQADGILSIHPPTQLTAIYNVAVAASQLVDNVPIRVINSDTVAMGQGFVALEAARLAASGADLDAVAARAAQVAGQVHLLAAVDTLRYLHRGGRVGAAANLVGTALQIKPILYVAQGSVEVFARPRTKAKAVRVMLEYVAQHTDSQRLHAAILHADVPQEAEDLRRRLIGEFDCAELYVTEFTPVMGAHVGPGLLGVAFYAEDAPTTQGLGLEQEECVAGR